MGYINLVSLLLYKIEISVRLSARRLFKALGLTSIETYYNAVYCSILVLNIVACDCFASYEQNYSIVINTSTIN